MSEGDIMETIVNYDTDGVTGISYRNLENLASSGKELEAVVIKSKSPCEVVTLFHFTDGTAYEASGFSIGYSGEGPRGLYRSMQLFVSDLPEWGEFGIFKLDSQKDWIWTNKFGEKFIQLNNF